MGKTSKNGGKTGPPTNPATAPRRKFLSLLRYNLFIGVNEMRVKNITVTVSVRVSAMVRVSLVWFVISNNVGGIKCRHLPNIAIYITVTGWIASAAVAAMFPAAGTIACWLCLWWPDQYHLPFIIFRCVSRSKSRTSNNAVIRERDPDCEAGNWKGSMAVSVESVARYCK